MSKILLTEAAENALTDYLEYGEEDGLVSWLSSTEGMEYLADLRSRLPEWTEVYRGLNGVSADPGNPYLTVCGGTGEEDGRPYVTPTSGIVSYTTSEYIAEQFAIGDIHFLDTTPAEFGAVLETSARRDQIIYHSDHVDIGYERFDEAEVLVQL